MDSPRSFFSKASSSRNARLSDSRYELPRWRSSSPMAASIIPPPIVQSTYLATPTALTQSIAIEPPSPLQDRQSGLEADLQFLLDAQAAGLVRGIEGGLQDDETSNGSTTPTARSVGSGPARQQKRPPRRKPGLRSARKGIYNSMLALASLKEDEMADIDDEVREKDQELEQIDEWEKKRDGLEEATRTADADEETVRAQRLRHEADVLQGEINNVELQLAHLKSRHRKLMRQASAVENSVQAKLASYTSSLRILDEDVQKFLSREPPDGKDRHVPEDGSTSLWQLPAKRRTLDMAKQHWNEERKVTVQLRESSGHEKAALEEGAAVWRDVIIHVTEFERSLRTEVSSLSDPAMNDSSREDKSQRLKSLLDQLGQVTAKVQTSHELATERNWNLLIAAIGAELDALRQGKQVLETLLNPEAPDAMAERHPPGSNEPTPSPGVEIHELNESFETSKRRMSADSDPDPELMFSKADTDTE